MGSNYKMTFGRKFWAGIFGIIVLMYIFTMSLIFASEAITASFLITLSGLVVAIIFAYIGGNVWNKWVKSAHFQPDILAGREK